MEILAGKHWHGATSTTAMTHIAVQESLVTDQEYVRGVPQP